MEGLRGMFKEYRNKRQITCILINESAVSLEAKKMNNKLKHPKCTYLSFMKRGTKFLYCAVWIFGDEWEAVRASAWLKPQLWKGRALRALENSLPRMSNSALGILIAIPRDKSAADSLTLIVPSTAIRRPLAPTVQKLTLTQLTAFTAISLYHHACSHSIGFFFIDSEQNCIKTHPVYHSSFPLLPLKVCSWFSSPRLSSFSYRLLKDNFSSSSISHHSKQSSTMKKMQIFIEISLKGQ